MGVPVDMMGTVDSVSACPPLQNGPGRVVLTTVNHLSNFVYDLTLKDASGNIETLGVTGYHRFYDKALGWTQAQFLRVGEVLRGDHGDLTVGGLVREPGTARVYNITVEADHVYYAGDLTALTHNNCPPGTMEPQRIWTLLQEMLDEAVKNGTAEQVETIMEMIQLLEDENLSGWLN